MSKADEIRDTMRRELSKGAIEVTLIVYPDEMGPVSDGEQLLRAQLEALRNYTASLERGDCNAAAATSEGRLMPEQLTSIRWRACLLADPSKSGHCVRVTRRGAMVVAARAGGIAA